MAVDHGRARAGLAVSDTTGTIVRPLEPIKQIDTPNGWAVFERVVREQAPEVIVVGEPILMSGGRGTQARHASRFAARVRARLDVTVTLVDERLTTVEATRRLRESGSRTSVDSAAACVLLEAYLHAEQVRI